MLWFALLLLIVALLLLWQAGKRQRASGLPAGRIIYADMQHWGAVEKPFYDPTLNLTGKPDYLVQQGDQVIPVEVKTSRISEAPYDAHIFQLAAYCLLVERCLGKRPAYGILHYPNRTFAIDYTPALEEELLSLLSAIQGQSLSKAPERSHEVIGRCSACGYRSICDQSLLSH
jgi:CRISPR-associated exonuclease Cas4